MRWRIEVPSAVVAFAVVVGGGYVVDSAEGDTNDVLGPGVVDVELGIEHSRFSRSRLDVAAGTTVRFVVRNTDPIHHELIVGDQSVHDRHRDGTESLHPPVPGEVSVGPNETRSTIFTFDEPGTVTFACHLPGHLAYGMEGEVAVH